MKRITKRLTTRTATSAATSAAKSAAVAIIAGLMLQSPALADGDWTEKVSVHGDLRYRHELVDKEGKPQRNRQRVRARFGIKADVGSDVKLNFSLASGSGDPVSTNQTLDGGFSTKQINLDIASFSWAPKKAPGLSVSGGKIKMPFHKPGKTELFWDGDLRPEGLAASYKHKSGSVEFFITAAGFWLNEESKTVDAGLRAAQAGVKVSSANGKTSVTGGAGFFDYSNLQGRATIFEAMEGFGNTLDGSGNYMYDYNIVEVFGEVATKAGSLGLKGYFDYANNTDPSDNNMAWLAGASVSSGSKKVGSWKASYSYRRTERDAVLGVFADSDFGGGGTDAQGHEFALKVKLGKKVYGATTYFVNNTGLSSTKDYKRFQLDAIFKL